MPLSGDAARVWITRARPGAEDTARRVAALRFEPLVLPLLDVQPLGDGPIDLGDAAALAFTSANAVRAFVARAAAGSWNGPVFSVGDATAAVAREAGFADVRSAEGDVAALAALIARARPDGPVLHLSADVPAGDLAAALAKAGFAALRLNLYQTRPVTLNAMEWNSAQTSDAVLLHSARAAGALATALAGRDGFGAELFCLSAAVAAPLSAAGFHPQIAVAPNDEALMASLSRWAADARR